MAILPNGAPPLALTSVKTGAVLFDLDGTLVDSLADIAASMNHVLGQLGHPTHSEEAIRHFVGEGARHLVSRSMPERSSEAAIDHALVAYKERYRSHLVVSTRPYEGIVPLLSALRSQGTRLGVVTNKPHPAAQKMVDQLFASGSFGVVLGEEHNKPRKPDPAPALEAASVLGVAKERCVFVGDTSVDMHTARAANMVAVGVTWGFRGRDELVAAGAHHVVESVPALSSLLLGASSSSSGDRPAGSRA
jgi:phosphoglycolate phosphatase